MTVDPDTGGYRAKDGVGQLCDASDPQRAGDGAEISLARSAPRLKLVDDCSDFAVGDHHNLILGTGQHPGMKLRRL